MAAARSIIRSPVFTELMPPVRHKRYIPARAMATAAQVFMLIFFFREYHASHRRYHDIQGGYKTSLSNCWNISPYCWHNMSVIRAAAHTKAP